MACRLDGANPFSEPLFLIRTLEKKLQRHFKRNSYIFIQENAFENCLCLNVLKSLKYFITVYPDMLDHVLRSSSQCLIKLDLYLILGPIILWDPW